MQPALNLPPPINPILQQLLRPHLQTPDRLAKDLNPPDLLTLGLKPIAQYDYVNACNMSPDPRDRINPVFLETVKENIAKVKGSDFEYYYLNNLNPIVAQVQKSGQIIWKAVNACTGSHAKAIGNLLTAKDQSVHVNTGTHGDMKGMIPADGEFFLATRLGDPAFFSEDTRCFNNIPDKTSFLQISSYVRPIYPEKANHVIDAWCFSFSTLFTDFKHHMIPKDPKGHFLPTIFKCTVTHKIMDKPMYSPECSSIEGKTHYYDKATVEALIKQNEERMDLGLSLAKSKKAFDDCFKRESENLIKGLGERDPNMLIKCRLEGCGKTIYLGSFIFDKHLANEIVGYKLSQEKVSLKDREIVQLKDERQKDGIKIQALETDKANLQNDKVVLNGRVTVLTEEKRIEKQEKDRVLNLVEQKDKVIDLKEKEIFHLQQEPHYQEKVQLQKEVEILKDKTLLVQKYQVEGVGGWKTRLYMQKEYSKFRLDTIFNGMKTFGFYWERPNSFISRFSTREDRDKNEHIFERFLAEKRADIQLLAKKKLAAYEGAYDHIKVSFTSDEYAKFLLPLMNKAFDDGSLSKRAVDQTVEYEVAIQEKPVAEWGSRESDRYMPKTYEETVKEILGEALRYELCEQMLKTLAN